MDTPSEADENDSDDDDAENDSETDVIDDVASSEGGPSVRGSKPLTAAAEFAATLAEYDSDGWGELDEEVSSSDVSAQCSTAVQSAICCAIGLRVAV
jgi:hypothetical protein